MDAVRQLGGRFFRSHPKLYLFAGILWLGFALYVLIPSNNPSLLSPYTGSEVRAQSFEDSIGEWGNYSLAVASDADHSYLCVYRTPKTYEEGFQYKSALYNEQITYIPSQVPDRIFYVRDFPWEKMPSDRIIDYWIQGFKVSQEKEVFSVCYQFRSGAVLQVADLYDIYGKPEKTLKPHKYRVVRMFFVGDRYKKRKYRKYFGKAYFETEANIQHYKQLMKEGKGWVQQANRYIKEKEVKEEEPILDYRTNPDYYKPLSQRGK